MKTKNRVNKLMCLFCTGLTDEMRNDFMLMKDLAVHTRVDPKARNQNLMRFMGSIQRCVCCNCVTKHTKQGFINVFSRKATGIHKNNNNLDFWSKNWNFPLRITPDGQNHPDNQSNYWHLNKIAHDPPFILWRFLEYFRGSKSIKSYMRSNCSPISVFKPSFIYS